MIRDARSELVRIDSRGEAHPVGPLASQRLRDRQGAYRMLPAPLHVVLMRSAGEDGKPSSGAGTVVRLCGEISRAGVLPEIFGLIAQTGWRGELVVLDGDNERSVFFNQGNVVGVETTEESERLGNVMYRFGGVSAAERELLTKEGPTADKIGTRAVELGIANQGQVFGYLRKQVTEVVYSTLTASDGTYFFLDDFDQTRLASKQAQNANALLMDCVTRLDEIRYFREKIPSDQYVPQRVSVSDGVPDEFRRTFDEVDGARSIQVIGRVTGDGEFATTRAIYALLRSGSLTLNPPPLGQGLQAVTSLANDALRRLHATAEASGRADAVRSALASFASGAGVFDLLFRHAGPNRDGTFDERVLVRNAELVAHPDPEVTLRRMLHEYVGFALFSLGDALNDEEESRLKAALGPLVDRLQPPG